MKKRVAPASPVQQIPTRTLPHADTLLQTHTQTQKFNEAECGDAAADTAQWWREARAPEDSEDLESENTQDVSDKSVEHDWFISDHERTAKTAKVQAHT